MYPFAGLANEVSPITPRLLLNRDSVGAWRTNEINSSSPTSKGEGEKEEKEEEEEETEGNGGLQEDEFILPTAKVGNYRDVQMLGDCDDGVLQLARLLGWEEELILLAKEQSM